MSKINVNGVVRDMTAEEQTQYDADYVAPKSSKEMKLDSIREMRNLKLIETDFYALSDVTMSEAMTSYRQGLRDIPQNNTTEEQYDLLLARVDGELTHSVWTKPE
jgi:hypothetical protein